MAGAQSGCTASLIARWFAAWSWMVTQASDGSTRHAANGRMATLHGEVLRLGFHTVALPWHRFPRSKWWMLLRATSQPAPHAPAAAHRCRARPRGRRWQAPPTAAPRSTRPRAAPPPWAPPWIPGPAPGMPFGRRPCGAATPKPSLPPRCHRVPIAAAPARPAGLRRVLGIALGPLPGPATPGWRQARSPRLPPPRCATAHAPAKPRPPWRRRRQAPPVPPGPQWLSRCSPVSLAARGHGAAAAHSSISLNSNTFRLLRGQPRPLVGPHQAGRQANSVADMVVRHRLRFRIVY